MFLVSFKLSVRWRMLTRIIGDVGEVPPEQIAHINVQRNVARNIPSSSSSSIFSTLPYHVLDISSAGVFGRNC